MSGSGESRVSGSKGGARVRRRRSQTRGLMWVDGLALALLVLLALLFYRRIALTNLILPGGDAFTYFYPYRGYAAQAVREGRIPLWNPYLFLGVPFLANSQAAVLYPLNLALCWLPAPKLVAWSIVLHVAMAAAFAYLYARCALRLSPLAAFLGGSAFAWGGYLSGQVEHINQLNVSAWFPLLLLLWELRRKARWPALVGLGAVLALGLLAGHAQSSYISMVGLCAYALLPVVWAVMKWAWHRLGRKRQALAAETSQGHGPEGRLGATQDPSILRDLLRTFLDLGIAGLLGVGLAAVQLTPTLELSRLSIRGGGLTYREAVTFSLRPLPRLLRYTFLPAWGLTPGELSATFGGDFFTEYLAYVGLVPLLVAAGAVGLWVVRVVRKGNREAGSLLYPAISMLVLAGLGVLLALGLYNPLYWLLYKIVPGFALFRVPARWLLLYAFGAAMLCGMGLETCLRAMEDGHVWKRALRHVGKVNGPRAVGRRIVIRRERGGRGGGWSWAAGGVLVAIALAELFGASLALPLHHPTAPEAFSSLRTAPAHILVAQAQEAAPGRFLSMSDITFDPGDLAEIEHMFRGQLSEKAIYDYVVSVKRKEILAPNLPLAWRIYAVDGYDGGVLPLARYVQLQRLFLAESAILTDGRLREGLERTPPSRLLSILGVRYVITDKVHDVWIDDVFYDLAFDAILGEGAAPSVASDDWVPYTATALGVVSYLEGAEDVADGVPVARITLTSQRGEAQTFTLYAGQDTAEGLYDADPSAVAHTQAQVGHRWRDQPEGADYVTRLRWDSPTPIARVEVRALPFEGRLHVRGMALIDERDGSNVPLILSTDGRYRRVHSGDVKIYEVLDALPRAYAVHRTKIVPEDEAAIAAMADPAFDPAHAAILAAGIEMDERPPAPPQVTVTAYRPQEIVLQAALHAPGYLVLGDTWYPGWRATVDGERAAIERANLHFRAVYLDEGTHTVRFAYRPTSVWLGLAISVLALLGVVLLGLRRLVRPRLGENVRKTPPNAT